MHAGPVLLTAVLLGGLTACSGGTPTPLPTTDQSVQAPEPTETLLPSPTADVSTVGDLAEGFPVQLLPVPEGSEILMSAAQPEEGSDLTAVSLNLRSPLTTEDLTALYRGSLTAAGFVETTLDPGTGLAAGSTFVRGAGEVLTLGVLDRDGLRTVTLGGTVLL